MNSHHAKKPATQFQAPVLRAFEAAARSGMLRLYTREGLEFALRGADENLADLKKAAQSGAGMSRSEKLLQARLLKIKNAVGDALAEGPMA